MAKYDFFIAGRWRNINNIKPVLDAVRASGKTAYCFIENEYEGEAVAFKMDDDPDILIKQTEELPQDDPFIRKTFALDIAAVSEAENLLLVLPAGIAGHIEAGA